MNPALRDSVAHVFVDDVGLPELADHDEHHLSRVLRLRDGERVTVCDGKGSWRECVWSAGNLSPIGEVIVEATRANRVGVAFVPVKGDRNEWAVQKLTEIGVDDIVVLSATRRSVVRWTNEAKQMQKLRLVAREAAMQSRRTFLPSVEGLVALDEVMRRSGAAVADPDAPSRPGGDVTLVAIGPEGGFDEDEISPSAARVSLGDTILRAETATLVAATLLVARRER
ncbi:MAG: RsmE family RNA methyltransferase [Ilumatobacteraceae bacterium]